MRQADHRSCPALAAVAGLELAAVGGDDLARDLEAEPAESGRASGFWAPPFNPSRPPIRVEEGWRTTDEMSLLYLTFVPREAGTRARSSWRAPVAWAPANSGASAGS